MLTLLMVRKDMQSIISGLRSANKKLFLKNLYPLFLSDKKKLKTTILQTYKIVQSIF